MSYRDGLYLGPDLPKYGLRLAAGAYDFVALGYGRARRVVCVSDGSWSVVKYAKDYTEGLANASTLPSYPLGALTAGFSHDTAGVVAITFTGEIVAYFD